MAIKSGIGIGEAQVYDTSNLENNYFKLLQREAQETAKFQEELVDLISKVKTDGARDIDKPLIAKGYDEIRELYRQASSIKNKTQRNLARAQITSGIESLNEAAARSAAEAKLYTETLGRVATTGQFLYDPNKLNEFKQRISKPITELSAFNPLDLERIPDDSVRDKAYDNLYTELKNKSTYQTRKLGGGKEQEVGIVDPKIVASNIVERIGKSPEWLNLATRNYIQANPDKQPALQDIIQNEVQLYMDRRGNEYIGAPTRIPKATGTGTGSGDDVSNPSNYEVTRGKTFVTSPTYDRNGKVTSSGKPIITFDTFVTTPVGQPFATPQIGNAFNITEGKSEPISSKKGLRITGMGVKNGNLRVTVVDDDEVEYYLKPQDIPLNIRNGKQYKAAERALGSSSTPKPTGKSYTVNGKSYSEAQLKAAANASGMTLDEYIKQVKAK